MLPALMCKIQYLEQFITEITTVMFLMNHTGCFFSYLKAAGGGGECKGLKIIFQSGVLMKQDAEKQYIL